MVIYMAIGNGFMPTYGFKVDPDNRQDRKSGEAITRKMSSEEIEKYGPPIKIKTDRLPGIATVPGMVRKGIEMTKINRERLIEICTEHGFTAQAYRIAAKEFDVPSSSVANYVSNNKLKKIVVGEKKQNSEEPMSQEGLSEKSEPNAKTSNNVSEELEIITKIKFILRENKSLKENMSKIKAALEDILKSIA